MIGFNYDPVKEVFSDINNIINPITDFKKFLKDPLSVISSG